MKDLKRGVDIPVRHSECNGRSEYNGELKNPPSVMVIAKNVQTERGGGLSGPPFGWRKVWDKF